MRSTYWHSRLNLDYRMKNKFRRKFSTLQKKRPNLTPFTVESKSLAINWWGKSWNANLRNFTNKNVQLEKGKLYLRCEAIADIKITGGHIEAVILGSKAEPYTVTIDLTPLPASRWKKIEKQYDQHLDSFEKVLDHQFPRDMAEIFSNKPTGLLPSPKEIKYECSCSESRRLCKHAMAVLFALGVMIDQDGEVLFGLRGVSVYDLISKSIHAERKNILRKIKSRKIRTLKHTNPSELFNIKIQKIDTT